jgi:hypothetical protein
LFFPFASSESGEGKLGPLNIFPNFFPTRLPGATGKTTTSYQSDYFPHFG